MPIQPVRAGSWLARRDRRNLTLWSLKAARTASHPQPTCEPGIKRQIWTTRTSAAVITVVLFTRSHPWNAGAGSAADTRSFALGGHLQTKPILTKQTLSTLEGSGRSVEREGAVLIGADPRLFRLLTAVNQ
jgi:hypothetical protein